jgi:hypothetical protein
MIIIFLIGKIILGGYWLIFAPALFLPLGTIVLSPPCRAWNLGTCGTRFSSRICGVRGDFSTHSDVA